MQWWDPATQVSFGFHEPAASAKLNRLGADLTFLAAPPACRMLISGAQSMANSNWSLVNFDVAEFDTDRMGPPNTAVGYVRCNTAGVYFAHTQATFAPSGGTATFRGIVVLKNDTTGYGEYVTTSATDCTVQCSALIPLVAGDLITVRVNQISGSTLALEGDTTNKTVPAMLNLSRIGGL